MKNYKDQLGKILDLEQTEFVYNSEWLSRLSFEDLLELQSQFTVAQMIERENFRERYKAGKPIGLQEFTYPLMQGYDSVEIRADVEVGGTDQTFNMLAGRTIQKMEGQEPQDVIMLSLIEGLDGRKMSKSYGNIVGINNKPNDMFGKIMSMKDELMIDYFKLCTNLSLEEIEKIGQELAGEKTNPRDIKARLAREIVALYHGEKAAKEAENEFNRVHRERELPSEVIELDDNITVVHKRPIIDLLVLAKLASSKSEAKRLVQRGGVKINGKTETDWQKDIVLKKGLIIQVGKRKFRKIAE